MKLLVSPSIFVKEWQIHALETSNIKLSQSTLHSNQPDEHFLTVPIALVMLFWVAIAFNSFACTSSFFIKLNIWSSLTSSTTDVSMCVKMYFLWSKTLGCFFLRQSDLSHRCEHFNVFRDLVVDRKIWYLDFREALCKGLMHLIIKESTLFEGQNIQHAAKYKALN